MIPPGRELPANRPATQSSSYLRLLEVFRARRGWPCVGSWSASLSLLHELNDRFTAVITPARMSRIGVRRGHLAMADVPHPQSHQITCTQLAVDSKVEQSEFPASIGEPQTYADGPDFFQFEWGFLPNELALVPGLATSRSNVRDSMAASYCFRDSQCASAARALLDPKPAGAFVYKRLRFPVNDWICKPVRD